MQHRRLCLVVALWCSLGAALALGRDDPSLSLQPDVLSPSFVDTSATVAARSSGGAPLTPCQACRSLIVSVSEQAIRLSYSRNDIVIAAQTYCQQHVLSNALKLQCTIYDEVDDLLARGNFVSSSFKVNYTAFQRKPDIFCNAVEFCGQFNMTRLPASPPVPEADGRGAVIMRMKLKRAYADIPRSSPNWAEFVRTFLGYVATTLELPVQRLELHMHPKDELAEIVINRSGNPADPSQDDNIGTSPEFLARLFRSLVEQNSNAIGLNGDMLDMLDRSFTVQIVPLVVFPTVQRVQLPPVVQVNSTGPSCRQRLLTARAACGDTFRCGANCKRDFKPYLTYCLSATLDPLKYQQVEASYNEFFRICESCTPKRDSFVRERCILNSTTANLPLQCTYGCARFYQPYYDDCLFIKMEDVQPEVRRGVEGFYQLCQKCSQQRLDAVRSICAPSSGSKDFPTTCVPDCSAPFQQFYTECLDWQRGLVPTRFVNFKEECEITDAGGLGVRLRLERDITTISNLAWFRAAASEHLATVLELNTSRVTTLRVTGVPATATTAPRVDVDFLLAVSSNSSETSPLGLLELLRSLVASPASRLYRSVLLVRTLPAYGVDRLVGSTDVIDTRKSRSPLEVANHELRRAVESNATLEIKELWTAIVLYQTLAAKNNVSLLPELKWRHVIIDWRTAIAEGQTPEQIAALAGKVSWFEAEKDREAMNATDPTWPLEINMRRAEFRRLDAIAANAPKEQVDMLAAAVRWRAALRAGATQPVIDVDRARFELLEAIFKNVSTAAIDEARAKFVWLSSLINTQTYMVERDLYFALFRLMRARNKMEPQLTMDMHEANVTLRRAVFEKEPTKVVQILRQLYSWRLQLISATDLKRVAWLNKKIIEKLEELTKLRAAIKAEADALAAAQAVATQNAANQTQELIAALGTNATNSTNSTANGSTGSNVTEARFPSYLQAPAAPAAPSATTVKVDAASGVAAVAVGGSEMKFTTKTPEVVEESPSFTPKAGQNCYMKEVQYWTYDEVQAKRVQATRRIPVCTQSPVVA